METIAEKAISGNNNPFYFMKKDKIIAVATDLKSFYAELKNIPLEIFCFHAYRSIQAEISLNNEQHQLLPRCDIALWIEYSLGDTQLAQKVFRIIMTAVGEANDLSAASKFKQLTTKKNVLSAIKERLDFFTST